MSNQLKQGTIRTSYVESKVTSTALDILATAKGTNKSALVREATAAYLAKHDPGNEIMRLSASLVSSLPDDAEERATAEMDPALQAEVAKILGRLRAK